MVATGELGRCWPARGWADRRWLMAGTHTVARPHLACLAGGATATGYGALDPDPDTVDPQKAVGPPVSGLCRGPPDEGP